MEKFIMIFAALMLSACVSQPKTDSEKLRVVGEINNCEIITNLTGSGTWGRSKEDAVKQVKYRAAATGANAIYFENIDSRFWGSTVFAKALHCS